MFCKEWSPNIYSFCHWKRVWSNHNCTGCETVNRESIENIEKKLYSCNATGGLLSRKIWNSSKWQGLTNDVSLWNSWAWITRHKHHLRLSLRCWWGHFVLSASRLSLDSLAKLGVQTASVNKLLSSISWPRDVATRSNWSAQLSRCYCNDVQRGRNLSLNPPSNRPTSKEEHFFTIPIFNAIWIHADRTNSKAYVFFYYSGIHIRDWLFKHIDRSNVTM